MPIELIGSLLPLAGDGGRRGLAFVLIMGAFSAFLAYASVVHRQRLSISIDKFISIDRRWATKATWLELLILSAVFVAAFDGKTLLHGFFRYDDFEFLSFNRLRPLSELLFLTHGDHTLPLLRLEVAVMHFLFGVQPLFYNLSILLIFTLIHFFSLKLLRSFGTGLSAMMVYLCLCVGWPLWGEITTGYYCLLIYMQCGLLALLSCWTYEQTLKKKNQNLYKAMTALFMIAAPFVDLSGLWVPCAVVLISWALYCHHQNTPVNSLDFAKKQKWVLLVAICTLLLAGAFNVFVFSKSNHFLSMAGGSFSLASFALNLFYILAGAVGISMLAPPVYYYVIMTQVMLPAMLFVGILAGLGFSYNWQKGSSIDRRKYMAITLTILGIATMLAFSRRFESADRWGAKYVGPVCIWVSILLSLWWDQLQTQTKNIHRTYKLLVLFLVPVVIAQVILTYKHLEVPGFNTRYWQLQDAMARRASVTELKIQFQDLLNKVPERPMTIPVLDGPYIASTYHSLHTYSFWRKFFLS